MLVLGTLASAVPANSEKFWIATLGSSSTEISYNSAIDTDSNVYIFGRSNVTGSHRQTIAKYDKNGIIQWQKQLSNNTHPGYYECWGTVDPSGNPIAYNSTTDGNNGGVVVTKLTPSGAITWQRALGTSNDAFADTIVTDSSGNIYGTGPMNDGAGYKMMLIKYNSSGVLQAAKYHANEMTDGKICFVTSGGNDYLLSANTMYGKSSTGAYLFTINPSKNPFFFELSNLLFQTIICLNINLLFFFIDTINSEICSISL
jgi:hypothetical protein